MPKIDCNKYSGGDRRCMRLLNNCEHIANITTSLNSYEMR
jgi:hypothetical protein